MAMTFLVILCSFLGIVHGQVTGDWRPDDQGMEYYISTILEETQVSWYAGRTLCQQNGGDLASIHSDAEKNFITQYSSELGVGGPLWNGLNDLDDWDDRWRWSDGTGEHGVNYWADNQPDNTNLGNKCAWQWANGTDGGQASGDWYNAHCDSWRGFICKRTEGQSDPVTDPPTPEVGGYCPTGYYGGAGNKCFKPYYRDFETGSTWEEAVQRCREDPGINADLASIHTDQEHAIVTSFVQIFATGMWIGLNRISEAEPWYWVDNSQYDFSKWAPGEPTANEHCGEVWPLSIPGEWNNIDCHERRGFVCQTFKDPDNTVPTPNPSLFPCPDGFVSYYYACYKVIPPGSGKTWAEAEQDCRSMNSLLASSLDTPENAALQVMASEIASPVWLGLSDDDGDGEYVWIDTFNVVYTNWAENEPSRENGGGCVALHIDGFWKDDLCANIYGYICKYTTVTPPTTVFHLPGTCPDERWVEYGDSCYYFEKDSLQSKTWPDADLACFFLHEHSTLVSIHTDDENSFVYDNMVDVNPNAHTWIGLYRSQKDEQFRWADFSPVQYENWADGEPNGNATYSGCVRMYTSNGIEGGIWDDFFCDERAYNQFVCKAPKLPPNTTPTQGPGSCPDNWLPLGSYCYHFRPDDFSTWSMAQDSCSKLIDGSNLASIHYGAEDDWIREQMTLASILPEVRAYWIGYIKDGAPPNFYWFDGTSNLYENWAIGEPNDEVGSEKCVEVMPTGKWNDMMCEWALGFVCKMPKCPGSSCFDSDNDQQSSPVDSGGLSSGETAGIVIGVLLAVILLGIGIVLSLGFFGIIAFGPFANRNPSETSRLA